MKKQKKVNRKVRMGRRKAIIYKHNEGRQQVFCSVRACHHQKIVSSPVKMIKTNFCVQILNCSSLKVTPLSRNAQNTLPTGQLHIMKIQDYSTTNTNSENKTTEIKMEEIKLLMIHKDLSMKNSRYYYYYQFHISSDHQTILHYSLCRPIVLMSIFKNNISSVKYFSLIPNFIQSLSLSLLYIINMNKNLSLS